MADQHTRGEAARELRRLTEWAADLAAGGIGALPERVRRRAATILVDDLAAMAGARTDRQVTEVAALAARRGPGAEATLLTRAPDRAERGWAAFANGVAANWQELDEGYRRATCHGGLYTVPAAVAECEAEHAALGRALTSLVVGYEIVTRVARAYPAPRPPALHPHATLSPIGAAAAVSAARGHTARTLADAVSGAASLAMVGPFAHAGRGALVRNAWAGAGAQAGFLAADLAALGVAGSDDGLASVFADGLDHPVEPAALTEGLGERYAVEDGYHKVYACCQYAHAAVEAAHALRAGPLASFAPDEVASVRVETHPLALTLDGDRPENVLAGKFSVPHAVAATLVTGSTAPEVFSAEWLGDRAVAEVRGRVELSEHPAIGDPPHDRPARVTVELRGGARHSHEVVSALGGPDRPLSAGDLLGKIDALTAGRYPYFGEVAAVTLGEGVDWDVPLADLLARLTADAGEGTR
ncbi:MmgE/PrpD family protein [Streptomyces sedi]|uniref:MmgE/PrpD family protein n=1 Tax=Streptomyces sedi TaxID=555059 RepID=A0A5C4V5W5_9ACTN|nr:MmgE/PrpD family protein [Streptomyces sedi]TNM31211.1 MmgE/PrpD family protein [Streptomyces sedi]